MTKVFFLICFWITFHFSLNGQIEGGQNLLFIFDASGSMWQKMENSTKIQVAKKTMEDFSMKIPADSKVGLVAFGHTNASECNDIQTLIPPGAYDAVQFIAAVKSLDPKGKTPIALSLAHALEETKLFTGPVSIIFISDGLETCDGNACSLVRQARKEGIPITIHILGFGITEADQSSLECLAQAGGGMYVPADNADALATALASSIKLKTAGNAFLSVKATVDDKLADATIKVINKNPAIDPFIGRTYASAETNPRVFQLPAGTYNIEVKPVGGQGLMTSTLSHVIVHAMDTVFKTVKFQQGEMEVQVTRNGMLADAVIQVYLSGTTKSIVTSRTYTQPEHNPLILKIAPGAYDVEIASVEISGNPKTMLFNKFVANGGRLLLTQDFQSGELSIGARQGESMLDATISIIRQADHQSVGSGRTYTGVESNPKSFLLEPGTYDIVLSPVNRKKLSEKTFTVEIMANERVEKFGEW